MKSPIPDYLEAVLDSVRTHDAGHPASYIDVLAKADTSKMAVALATVDGTLYSAGDDTVEFSIQSISKVFVYALAIFDVGLPGVLAKIGVEPSGDPFNELSLERGEGNRPMNPMINAGAIMAHSLVAGSTPEERVERIVAILSKLAGRQLRVDEEVYEAEWKDAFRNMGLAFMLKAAGVLECSPADAVKGYVRQCSIMVNVRDLAMMAATLGNGGMHPVTNEVIISRDSVRQVLSVMTTCGMYDAAGDWVSNVGIPAKSGVAGGIMGALPGQLGIAAFSPRLDSHGHSVRGVAICEKLSRDMGLHMMDMRQIARSTVRQSVVTVSKPSAHDACHETCDESSVEVPVFEMRGAVRFAGAELFTRTVTRELSDPDSDDPGSGCRVESPAVVLNFKNTISLNPVAQRVIREVIHRLRNDGKEVLVIDPMEVLKTDLLGENDQPIMMDAVDDAFSHVGGIGYRIISDHDES